MTISRRILLKATAAASTIGTFHIGRANAQAAEFTYKYANNLPVAHPMNTRANEAVAKIKQETNGRVDIQIFPNNQLGSDTDMLSQVRSGGVEFFTLSPLILSTLVANASLSGIGFAFPNYDAVWKAMDGELGAYVRGQINKANLVVMVKKYKRILMVQHEEKEPQERYDGLKRFCGEHKLSHAYLHSINNRKINPGDLFIVVSDRDLVYLLKQADKQKLVPGKHFGLISYNDTPLKEILAGGITTLSTDFKQMGKTIASFISKKGIEVIDNPWKLNIRKSL